MSDTRSPASAPLLRELNARAVLDVIRARESVNATDLIEATGLSRATVHSVCDGLIRLGWVREPTREGGTRTGRPARRYEYNARAGYVLGLDVGAFKTTALLADLRGDCVAEVTRRFDGSRASASDRLHVVRQAVDSTLASGDVEPMQVLVVCVGLPGPVAADGQMTVVEEFEPWHTDLWSAIHEWYQWRVIVDNDANLAAVAERWRGVATGSDNFIVMLAGERLGSGLVVDGKLLRGSAGGAGEMAFLDLIDAVGSAWGVGWHARNLGSEAVARQRQAAGPDTPQSMRRRCNGDPDSLTAEMVFGAASAGDPLALGVVDQIAVKLAHTIAAMASLLNPELVVISGGVASACNVLLEPLKRRLPRLTTRPPEVVTSALGDKAVVIGAVRAALDDFSATFLTSLRF